VGADSSFHRQRTSVHIPKEKLMNTSNKARAAALVASLLITLTMVLVVADYAYPEAPAVLMASAVR
jgi:hypothetical protein